MCQGNELGRREGWKRILETANDIQVVGEATTIVDTPKKVLEKDPDVLLMDLKWFGDETAGWTTIRNIKSSYQHVKIIAITAYENLIRDARMAGADAALTKTFSREELLELIRELAQQDPSTIGMEDPILPVPEQLSERENEVLMLLGKGNTDQEIANSLGIAKSTVKNHVKSILGKFGAKNRLQATIIARQRGLLK